MMIISHEQILLNIYQWLEAIWVIYIFNNTEIQSNTDISFVLNKLDFGHGF